MNAALIVCDGLEARIGTLTAGREWFKPWRTISSAHAGRHPLQVAVIRLLSLTVDPDSVLRPILQHGLSG